MANQSELPIPGTNKGRGALTEKGHRRQQMVLSAASKMFSRFGYDGVSINDIGAAAGISGPGIYRYFNSKDDILIAIYEFIHSSHSDALQQVLDVGGTNEETLKALVTLQVSLANSEPDMIRIIDSEQRRLPEDTVKALREERRGTLQVISDLLRQIRPELSEEEIGMTVHALLALINSISHRRDETPLSDKAMTHLENMAFSVLGLSTV